MTKEEKFILNKCGIDYGGRDLVKESPRIELLKKIRSAASEIESNVGIEIESLRDSNSDNDFCECRRINKMFFPIGKLEVISRAMSEYNNCIDVIFSCVIISKIHEEK